MPGKEESIERAVDEPDVSVLLPLSGRIHRESTEKKRFVAFPAPLQFQTRIFMDWQKVDYSWTATNVTSSLGKKFFLGKRINKTIRPPQWRA